MECADLFLYKFILWNITKALPLQRCSWIFEVASVSPTFMGVSSSSPSSERPAAQRLYLFLVECNQQDWRDHRTGAACQQHGCELGCCLKVLDCVLHIQFMNKRITQRQPGESFSWKLISRKCLRNKQTKVKDPDPWAEMKQTRQLNILTKLS